MPNILNFDHYDQRWTTVTKVTDHKHTHRTKRSGITVVSGKGGHIVSITTVSHNL